MSATLEMQAVRYEPDATWIRDLAVGDLVTLESWYGVELIVALTEDVLRNGVKVRHMQTEWITPVLRSAQTRFVVRGELEPVTRWRAVAEAA